MKERERESDDDDDDDGGRKRAEDESFTPRAHSRLQQLQQKLVTAEEEPEGDEQLLQRDETELQQHVCGWRPRAG